MGRKSTLVHHYVGCFINNLLSHSPNSSMKKVLNSQEENEAQKGSGEILSLFFLSQRFTTTACQNPSSNEAHFPGTVLAKIYGTHTINQALF